MPQTRYEIGVMRPGELDTVMQWAAREGWNPGRHDAACFHAADPEGFWVGRLDGVAVASISVVRYGADYGFLGLYIVTPEHRGQGLGWALWQAGMASLGTRAVGLDGVVAQQDNYRRSGFELLHRNIRYTRRVADAVATPAPGPHGEWVDLRQWDRTALLHYDQAFFPTGRSAFLHAWVGQPGHHALGLLQHGRLVGYGVLRPCLEGHKIGPLFADSPEQAGTLLRALMAHAGAGSAVFLDIPEINPHALALVQRHGMSPMFETARMVRGTPVRPDMQRTYGITSFELG